jgi:hypothetical protein
MRCVQFATAASVVHGIAKARPEGEPVQEVELVEVRRSGFVTFVGVIALVIGVYNAVGGIAAIAKDDRTEAVGKVLFDIDISVWGWIWLVLGVVQILIGGLILTRHPTGLVLGVTWAAITAALTVFVIFVYPIWALIILGVDILIIWGLIENADEFA